MTLAAREPRMMGRIENPTSSTRTLHSAVLQGYARPNLVVTVSADDGRLFAVAEGLAMYGEGDTRQSAVGDLLQSLVNLYRELASEPGLLAPELRDQLHRLEILGVDRLDLATP